MYCQLHARLAILYPSMNAPLRALPLLLMFQTLLLGGRTASQIISAPRSPAPTRLLFSFVTTDAGSDTELTISNTSRDTLGTVPETGSCTLSFYGSSATVRGVTIPIPAGKQVVI